MLSEAVLIVNRIVTKGQAKFQERRVKIMRKMGPRKLRGHPLFPFFLEISNPVPRENFDFEGNPSCSILLTAKCIQAIFSFLPVCFSYFFATGLILVINHQREALF